MKRCLATVTLAAFLAAAAGCGDSNTAKPLSGPPAPPPPPSMKTGGPGAGASAPKSVD